MTRRRRSRWLTGWLCCTTVGFSGSISPAALYHQPRTLDVARFLNLDNIFPLLMWDAASQHAQTALGEWHVPADGSAHDQHDSDQHDSDSSGEPIALLLHPAWLMAETEAEVGFGTQTSDSAVADARDSVSGDSTSDDSAAAGSDVTPDMPTVVRRLRGTVEKVVFQGASYDLYIRLQAGERLVVSMPSTGIVQAGQDVTVRVPPQAIQLLSHFPS